ncbi:hypothetical protein RND81_10G165500 [Saponaria officinalis]|uniref:PGG domain-containing protein n=1 Tax=Saponaria officinalis TaxID=3572 RepID=A0AAW1I5C2_SAPOF
MDKFEEQVKKLYNAAIEGDVPSLLKLLQQDPRILDRCNFGNSGCFIPSPLHVAADFGHLEFTREILNRKPELTEEVDQIRRWSPLHVASGKGHLEIVQALISVNPNMCLARDVDGLNPVHVSAIRGQVHVIDEILKVVPQAARERTNAGVTVLHLCVKHCQIDALIFLINVVNDAEVINLRDFDGNSILHLAVATKQPEMVKFLVKNKKMEKNAINTNDLTAMDIHIRSKTGINHSEIWVALKKAKALKAKTSLKPRHKHKTWLERQRNALMVVASLIATMAFQVGINPPGGAWQDNMDGHIAGNSIMADVDKDQYDRLLIYSTIGLISSLSVILLLISGLPCKRLFVGILMIALWIAVTTTTSSYMVSVHYLTGNRELLEVSSKNHHALLLALVVSTYFWIVLVWVLLLANALRFIVKALRRLVPWVAKLFRVCFSIVTRRP